VTRSLRSLDNKLDILARHADIFGIISIHIQITYTYNDQMEKDKQ
jgi:hypothetical protein